MRKIVIFGNNEFSVLVYNYFLQLDYQISGFVVDDEYLTSKSFCGLPIIGSSEITKIYPPSDYDLFVAVGYSKMNTIRQLKYNEFKKLGYSFANLIHSSSIIFPNAKIGTNCMVLENCVIQSNVEIKNNTLIWANSTICHDSILGENCFIASQVCINGFVNIKDNSFLGANSTIRNNITIAKYSLIGSGCTVLEDTKEKSILKSLKPSEIPVDSLEIKSY
jgi:sugar O-acyltransferase (sialic acid O-acetyltransferase NeuD family)